MNMKYIGILVFMVTIGLSIIACNHKEDNQQNNVAVKQTPAKSKEQLPFPAYLKLHGLKLKNTQIIYEGAAVNAQLECEMSAYMVYMLYLDVLKENKWSVIDKMENGNEFFIKAISQYGDGLELSLHTKGNKVKISIVFGNTDYD